MPVSIKKGLRPSVRPSSTAIAPSLPSTIVLSSADDLPHSHSTLRVTPPSTKHPPSSLIIARTRRRPTAYTVPSHTRARKSSALSLSAHTPSSPPSVPTANARTPFILL
ncbi:hypothetical protein ARMSODRAFT_1022827 [Armillaria solidipes]|uniref:Uncharacterized protein n=1 Tax=Armillaria solidipes TaxID=1076256 RepID=A0A2H3BFM2_9AGAR|nr:hypothetical protein ARMSODRAFT_1022827 [Armillaria solidipes]